MGIKRHKPEEIVPELRQVWNLSSRHANRGIVFEQPIFGTVVATIKETAPNRTGSNRTRKGQLYAASQPSARFATLVKVGSKLSFAATAPKDKCPMTAPRTNRTYADAARSVALAKAPLHAARRCAAQLPERGRSCRVKYHRRNQSFAADALQVRVADIASLHDFKATGCTPGPCPTFIGLSGAVVCSFVKADFGCPPPVLSRDPLIKVGAADVAIRLVQITPNFTQRRASLLLYRHITRLNSNCGIGTRGARSVC